MGARKHLRAEQRKEENKTRYYASLRDCPTSPRKMRLVADMIRGVDVNKALDMLKFSPKEASIRMEKLLLSAISNWQVKNESKRIEESALFVKEVFVDESTSLKRIQPAPQGRAYRVRKRSNHVTIVVDSLIKNEEQKEVQSK